MNKKKRRKMTHFFVFYLFIYFSFVSGLARSGYIGQDVVVGRALEC